MSDSRRTRILEVLGEERGGEIADIAERAGYQFDDTDNALFVDENTVWPEGYDIDKVFPLNKDARARPVHRFDPSTWTLFLSRAYIIQRGFATTVHAQIKAHYEALVTTYFDLGHLKLGALADLRALREETQRIIEQCDNSLDGILSGLRSYLAVMFLEALRRTPEESQGMVATRFGQGFDLLLTGMEWDWISYQPIDGVIGYFPDVPPEITDLQRAALAQHMKWRNSVIDAAFPIEVRRIACEKVLAKIIRGEEVGPWSKKDEESLLPFREDLKCKSREGGRDIFDLYDLLNEKKYRGGVWLSHTDIYRALANRKAEMKSPNISRPKFIAGEIDRLDKAIGRQLEWRGANGFPGDNDVLVGKTNKELAGQLRDWLFEIGRSHQPKWLPEMV